MPAKRGAADPAPDEFGRIRGDALVPISGGRSVTVTDGNKDDEQRDRIADTSDELMERLTILKALESQKRRDPMSTPRFHELANEVTEVSRDIFSLALREEHEGNDLGEPSPSTIDSESQESTIHDQNAAMSDQVAASETRSSREELPD